MDNIIIPLEEKQQILDDINEWLKTTYFYKNPPAHLCGPKNLASNYFCIDAHKKKFCIYLRFGETWASCCNKSIVIASICFEKERSGYGTALLKKLTQIAHNYNYEIISIESVNDNSRAFALKFGFSEHKNPHNYIIETEKLVDSLNINNKQIGH